MPRKEHARWDAPVLHMTGRILMFLGLLMLLPALLAVSDGTDPLPFAVPGASCILASVLMVSLFSMPRNINPTEGLFMVSATWLLVILIGSVPFVMCGMGITDAFFESASGFTTTGATVIERFQDWDRSLLFWRSLSQWAGGIAFVLIFMSVLPLLGLGGRSLSINEVSGSGSKNFYARIKDVTKEFVLIYMMLTVVMLAACVVLGVSTFESLCLAMSTISTGGFLPVGSVAVYSVAVQAVVMVFMFLGGTSFYLHYRAVYKRDLKGYLENTEFRTMLLWFLVMTLIAFCILTGIVGSGGILDPSPEVFKDVLFAVISMGTTTGLSTADYSSWYPLAFILALVMLMGGSSGSTAGGVKIYRGVLVSRYIRVAMRRIIHPRAVFDIKVDDRSVDDNAVSSALSVVMMFCITVVLGSVVMMIYGIDTVDSVSMTLSSVMNTGIAPGTGSYAGLDGGMKVFLGILMWIGRLEILMALALVTPAFWKEMLRGKVKRSP